MGVRSPTSSLPRQRLPGWSQVLRKARAWSRKGRKTLRHHAVGGPDSRSPQLRACGTQSHSVSKPSPGLVEGVQGQGQHGRGFDRSHGRAGRKTVGGTPLGVPNTRRGQPGRLEASPVVYIRGTKVLGYSYAALGCSRVPHMPARTAMMLILFVPC